MISSHRLKSIVRDISSHLLIITVLLLPALCSYSQTVIPLYNSTIPGAKDVENQERADTLQNGSIFLKGVCYPTLTVFLPSKLQATGAAVIVCPGGGYAGLSITDEGSRVAQELTKIGVTAFVLKYRLPSEKIMVDTETGPLQDAQEALKLVRKNYKKWNIDTNKVGIMGFSAGGHLASTAGTHFILPVITRNDKISVRPDFMILIYPVISMMDSITHKGSRKNLLGSLPSLEKRILFSNELQVTPQTPPTFLVHSQEDDLVPAQNSLSFYSALLKNKVPSELHIYSKGKHGFGLNNTATKDFWFERCRNWMEANGWLNAD